MRKIIIIGCGSVAAEVTSYIDDYLASTGDLMGVCGYLGPSLDEYNASKRKFRFKGDYLGSQESFSYTLEYEYIVAFSNPDAKSRLIIQLHPKGLTYPNIIHPTALIAKSACIGQGNLIGPNCVLGPGSMIGNFNLFTAYGFVSHSCVVGSYNFFSSSGISGRVTVGHNNYFGIRATVLPDLIVGSNNVIQAGMIIDKNITNNETVFYKYKEQVRVIKK